MIIYELIDTSNNDELRKPSRLFFCHLENALNYQKPVNSDFSIYPRNTVDNQWISVKSKFPPYKKCVLVYLDSKLVTEAVYRGEYEKGVHIFRLELTREDTSDKVTHWMPLPEAPNDI